MKILILGGTKFLGRALVEVGMARGHQLTLFNRGRSNPSLFPELETITGDRSRDLGALRGRNWDAVIDTSGYVSGDVRAAAEQLAVDRYVFISSISVYADFSRSGLDESALLLKASPDLLENAAEPATYGVRKALCETALQQVMPGRALIVRPGILVGPHDPTDRFLYWVRRAASGGEMLAPAPAEAPMQLLDARDLASWVVQLVERSEAGIFNATGPRLSFGEMVEACRAAAGVASSIRWIDENLLLRKGVKPFVELPLWIPASDRDYAGHFAVDCSRARAKGLCWRPLVETARDVLAWDRKRGDGKSIGLPREVEEELLRGVGV